MVKRCLPPCAGPVAVALLAGALLIAGPAVADDARLDRLFSELAAADTADEADAVARSIWTEWFDYDGEDDDVRFVMMDGQEAAMRGMLAFAEERYGRAIELDPGYAEAWNRRATVRFLRGDYVGSIADIQEVLAREPRHFGALSGLGMCLVALDRPAEALEAFEAALEIHPFLPGPRAHVAILRERLSGDPI